jgi:excisionase family DNA binding protein
MEANRFEWRPTVAKKVQKYWNRFDAAKFLGCSYTKINYAIWKGWLPAYRSGKRILIKRVDVLAFKKRGGGPVMATVIRAPDLVRVKPEMPPSRDLPEVSDDDSR